MTAPASIDEFLELVRKSELVDTSALDECLENLRRNGGLPTDPQTLASLLVREGILAYFQSQQLLQGRWRGFDIGKFRVLERLGSGGASNVYLCEHPVTSNRVAVKVLYGEKAADPTMLERFRREARAACTLGHPNIVRGLDIDQDGGLNFLVMEFIEGTSLERIVRKFGPMDVFRACHYIKQAALGLEHAHEQGVVHRDIKPANLLLDRIGVVKILDMGLARFTQEDSLVLTQQEAVLGTADYISPEQTRDSHRVDIRTDIYSLGATFYYLLTGRTPYPKGSIAQKLVWLQTQEPPSLSIYRPEVPEELVHIIERMMAKEPSKRYQTPGDVVQALEEWTRLPIDPPPEAEMPKLSLVAQGQGSGNLRRPSSAAIAEAKAQEARQAETMMNSTTPTLMPRPSSIREPAKPKPVKKVSRAPIDQDRPGRVERQQLPRAASEESQDSGSDLFWFFWLVVAALLAAALGTLIWQSGWIAG